jgi:hypothetical protein
MSKSAITARLLTMSRLLNERGFVEKGVDMSPTAVTTRLRTMATLSDLCRRLGQATIVPPKQVP